MGMIQEAIKKLTSKKEEKEHIENVQRWGESIERKKLSANERDLMRYREEERQASIKSAVEKYRKRDMDDMWQGKKFNPVNTPNMFKDNVNLFKGGKSPMLQNDKNQLKPKNLFIKR